MSSWCILRTAPSRTVPLATALEKAGYRAWTPQEKRVVRLPRSKARREVTTSLTPTIVFADYERVPEFVALSRSAACKFPSFGVFRHLDVYPRIADRALNALRLAEQRGRPRETARTFEVDELVTFADAGFEGLVGRVTGQRGRLVLVDFPGFNIPIQIGGHNLLPWHAQAA
jgi:hypothetical protein